jgi:endonuclease/exonuclease/phosphatase (EEP) superfamily protein YafD
MEEESRFWQKLIGTALTLALLGLAGGFLGWLHPLGDSLAVGRALAAGAVLILAVCASLVGLRMAAFGSLLLAMLIGAQMFLAFNWPGPPGRYLVYQKNMLFRNSDLAALEADIRAAAPDIVALQEVSKANLPMLANLRDVYPHQLQCPGPRIGGAAILTQLTPVPGTEFCGPRLAVMQVQSGLERFWVVSVHLHWPWPYSQAENVEQLLPILDRLEGPAVMAGDFNMVRWGNSVSRLAGSLDLRAAGPTIGTYVGLVPWMPLPIDHVFAPRGGRVATRGAHGSDHLGLLAEIEL